MTHKPLLNILLVVGLLALPLALGRGPAAQAAPEAGTLYVQPGAKGGCTSWEDACELQAALSLAASGDEIWAAQGVYKPTTPAGRDTTFQLKSGVELYGGFDPVSGVDTFEERDWTENITVLSGDIDGNDITDPNGVVTDTAKIQGENAYQVVTGSGVNNTAILDGFTITGGNANDTYPNDSGGGMYNNNGSPRLTNVAFSGNTADWGGGMYNGNSNPILTNVTFFRNRAVVGGGGMINIGGSPTLTDVTFSRNLGGPSGGGMRNIGSSPTLTDITFSRNDADSGGGMANATSNPILTNVTFSGNTADWGGGMNNGNSNPILTNVTFSSNIDWGLGGGAGGMLNRTSNPILINVTFAGNSSFHACGGMYNEYSNPTLINAILWGTGLWGNGCKIVNASSAPVISYSDIQGSGGSGASWDTALGSDGGGNIDADPQFVRSPSPGDDWGTADDDFGDLRLQLISPAIDAGDNGAVPTGVTTDLDGKPRFVDIPGVPDTGNGAPPIVDMGAYEAQNLIFLPVVKR